MCLNITVRNYIKFQVTSADLEVGGNLAVIDSDLSDTNKKKNDVASQQTLRSPAKERNIFIPEAQRENDKDVVVEKDVDIASDKVPERPVTDSNVDEHDDSIVTENGAEKSKKPDELENTPQVFIVARFVKK
jgi:hypothetical protein